VADCAVDPAELANEEWLEEAASLPPEPHPANPRQATANDATTGNGTE
jgi:hypothetical protein